ncbi:MAG: hypothetical protein LCH26_02865 [Proteobacteria bacterium]|nr:hypothetical protein [Pseudomonadota bacterium]
MKRSWTFIALSYLIVNTTCIHASRPVEPDSQGMDSCPSAVVLTSRVDQNFSCDDFAVLLPFTHLVDVNGNMPYTLEGSDVTLENALKAQNIGWLSFYMTPEKAEKFTQEHTSFALHFSSSLDLIPFLDMVPLPKSS